MFLAANLIYYRTQVSSAFRRVTPCPFLLSQSRYLLVETLLFVWRNVRLSSDVSNVFSGCDFTVSEDSTTGKFFRRFPSPLDQETTNRKYVYNSITAALISKGHPRHRYRPLYISCKDHTDQTFIAKDTRSTRFVLSAHRVPPAPRIKSKFRLLGGNCPSCVLLS